MTEQKYLKIISDLFRLTGYATGALTAIYWTEDEEGLKDESVDRALKYLEEQQALILLQMDKGE